MADANLNIRKTDRRIRRFDRLERATGESTTVGAIDEASKFYLSMAGGPADHQTGAIDELLELAVDQGSVTAEEIAEVLDTDQHPVWANVEYGTGERADQ